MMLPVFAVTAVPAAKPILLLAKTAPFVDILKVMSPPAARMLLYLNCPSVGPDAVIVRFPPPVAAMVEMSPVDQLFAMTPNELGAVDVPVSEIAVPVFLPETRLEAAFTVPP